MLRQRGLLGDFDFDRSDFEPVTDLTVFSFLTVRQETTKYLEILTVK